MFAVVVTYWKKIRMKYWYCCSRLGRCLFQHVEHVTLLTTAPINAALTNLPQSGNHIFEHLKGILLSLAPVVTQPQLTFTTFSRCMTHLIHSVFTDTGGCFISPHCTPSVARFTNQENTQTKKKKNRLQHKTGVECSIKLSSQAVLCSI